MIATGPIGGKGPPKAAEKLNPAAAAKDAKLKKVAGQMEGAFVQQMYKSMRDTVPADGEFNGGSGEEMFTSMLDEHAATDTPAQWKHGLSESIYRQLKDAVHQQAATPAAVKMESPLVMSPK